MPTLAETRARLRRGLEDTDPVAPLWSDAELNEWLATAAREYGARFPREATVSIAAVGGQTEYALPTDARRVLRVESPAGSPIPRRAPRTGHESGAAQSWAHFGGAISLGYAPVAPLVVAYRGLYPFPANDSATFNLPDEGLDLAVAKRRGGSPEVTLALAAARRSYADALRCCRRVRG